MNESQRDFQLELFLRYVKDGKQPPPGLMSFVAGGVDEFLKGGKPWQVKTGRPPFGAKWKEHLTAVKCHALEDVGIDRVRGAIILQLTDKDPKTYRRYLQLGKSCANTVNTGGFSHVFALEELLENSELSMEERAALENKLEVLRQEDVPDTPSL